jgi:alpha-tubulin suppressor-like RCC1 family protein
VSSGIQWGYVFAGTGSSYAITTDGYLWRRSYVSSVDAIAFGESGDKPFEFRPFFQERRWRMVKASHGIAGGLDTEGGLWLWSDRYSHRDDPERPAAPIAVEPKHSWVDFCLGNKALYAVDAEGDLWKRETERLAAGNVEGEQARLGLAPLKTQARFARVICRENSANVFAIDAEHYLWGYGPNQFGELGNGDGDKFTKTVPVAEADMKRVTTQRWADIAIGPGFTLGIAADGSLWAWGNNSGGQLGTGNAEYRDIPTLVDNTRIWVSVTASYVSGAALSRDREIYTWGSGGLLGDGGAARYRDTPTRVVGTQLWGGGSAAK